MIEINLLPWRENKRRGEKKRAIIILLSIIGGVVSTIFFIHAYTQCLLHKQSQHNQQLREEITQFNHQIQETNKIEEEKKSLISRMLIIQHLALTRTLLVHLFDELIEVMPDDVYLSWIKKLSDRITLAGYSETSHSVVRLIRNLEENPLFKAPVLIEIKKRGVKKMKEGNEFTLSFNLLSPKCTYDFAK